MPSASAAGPAARSRTALRALLLGGTAFCGAAVLCGADGARAGTLPTQGAVNLGSTGSGAINAKILSGNVVTPSTASYTSNASLATVTLPSAARTLIDWTTFTVGKSNTLDFVFTHSASDIVLNRVPVGAQILVDTGGTVNATFKGSTGGNIWFLASGGVFIRGTVTANGVLSTTNPTLGANLSDLDLLSDAIGTLKTNLAAMSGLIDISGTVIASGAEIDPAGNVVLTGDIDAGARGAVEVATAGSAHQLSGAIAARTIDIASAGEVTLSGSLDASAKTGVGGDIVVTGENIRLVGASLDASGPTGGGAVRIGGDFHGGGILPQAATTEVDAVSTIGANATGRGNGGSVVLWSTDYTAFGGTIAARGAGGGRGGEAEVSSHELLAYGGFADLTAPGRGAGTLLLDPEDLTISATGPDTVNVAGTGPFTDTPAQASSVLTAATLNSQLAAASVIVSTVGSPGTQAGDIKVAAPVTWSSANSLTLDAAGAIAINSPITGSNAGSALVMNAGGAITQLATGVITVGTLSGSSGGDTTLTTVNMVGTLGPFASSGLLSFTDGTDLTTAGVVTATGGALTLNTGPNNLTVGSGGAAATLQASTALNLSGVGGTISGGTGSAVTLAAGVDFSLPQNITTSGMTTVTITGAAFKAAGNTLDTGGADLTINATTVDLTGMGSALSATGAKVTLTSTAGAIDEGGKGVITAGTLTGSSTGGDVTLSGSNKVGTLIGFASSGLLSFTDATDLTTAGVVEASGGALTLKTTGAKTLTIGTGGAAAALQASAALNLSAVGGTISGGTGSAVTLAAGADFSLPQDITTNGLTTVTITGAAFKAAGHTLGTGGADLTINAATIDLTSMGSTLTATGAKVTLVAGGTIDEGGKGVITAGTLTGSSGGGAAFDSPANAIGTFGPFTNTTAGDVKVADGVDLAVTGAVSIGSGTLTLNGAGSILGDTATITAAAVTGSSTGGASFNNTTNMNMVGAFRNFTNAGSGEVVFADGADLTVNTIANPVGSVKLSAAGALSVSGPSLSPGVDLILSAGTSLDVVAAATVVHDYAVTAQTFLDESLAPTFSPGHDFTVNARSSLALTSNITSPGGLTITSAGLLDASAVTVKSTAGALALTGGAGLDVGATVATAGSTSFTTTAGAITLTGSVNAGASGVMLTSAGAVDQTGGAITAASVTGASAGAVTLTGANVFASLAGFTNSGPGGISITDARAAGLTVTGAVNAGAGGTLTLATTNGGPLSLAADLTASGGGTVDLVSAGALDQTAGAITTGTLTGSSVGGAKLPDGNHIDAFGAFTNNVSGDVVLADAVSLSANTISDSVGSVNLSSTGALNVTGPALDPGVSLTLSAGTSLNLAASPIVAQDYTITAASFLGQSLVPTFSPGHDFTVNARGSFTLTTNLTAPHNLVVNSVGALDTTGAILTATGGSLNLGAASLTVGTAVAPLGSTNLATGAGGNISLQGPVGHAGQTLSLSAGGTVIQTPTGIITTSAITGSSVGGTTLDNPANAIGSFGAFTDTAGGAVKIVDSQNLMVTGAVNIGGGALTLVSAGTIAGDGARITAGTLTGSSAGGASFNNAANAIGALGPFSDTSNGNITVADSQNLSVTGLVSLGAGTLTLTTNSAASLSLGASVSAAGGTVDLVSAGPISQTAGTITTAILTGSSAGGASLAGANLFDALAGFTNSGLGALSITDAKAGGLTVSSAVDAGSGNILTLNASGGSMTLAASLSATGTGAVRLVSAGFLDQTAGVITTGTVRGSSAGGASLTDANLVASLSAFTNSGLGNVSIIDARPAGLTVTGAVDAGVGNTLTVTTTNGGPLALAANVSAAGATVRLVSAGPISQTTGIITTSALTGSSVGGASLTRANLFDTLAGFTNAGLGNVSITDAQTSGLTVSTAIDAGPGNILTLTTTNGGSLTLAADLTASGGAVDLLSAGPLSQTAGIITTSTLAGSSAGGAGLTAANLFDILDGFTNAGQGAVSIIDAKPTGLTVTGAVDAGSGNLLTLTADDGSLGLAASVSAAGGAVDLVSAGSIRQTAGIVTAGTLTGSSAGGASLARPNLFDTLAGFTNTGLGSVSVTDAKASGLTVSTAVDAGPGNTLILTTGGSLTLAANVSAAGATVDLASGGPIVQAAGIITASILSGSSAGGASLTAANLFDALAGFTNTGLGNVSIVDVRTTGLTLTGAVDAGSGNLLTLATSGGPLTLAADVSAAAGTVNLVSAGTLSQTAGIITTGALIGSSAGGARLTDANAFDALDGFTNAGVGNVAITDARATGLTVSAALDAGAGNSLTLTTTGSLALGASVSAAGGMVDLVSAGPISQTAGIVTTAILTGASAGGASLAGANLFDTLAGFTNSGLGAVSIADAKASGLTVSTAIDAGAGNILALTTNSGPLTLAANLNAAGAGTVDLVSAGSISQTAGIITTGTLRGSSAGGANLTDANLFASLGGFTNAGVGAVSIADARSAGLTVSGAVDAGTGNTLTLTTTSGGPLTLTANVSAAGATVDLVSAGALSQTAGIITTSTLIGSSAGGASLTRANLFDTLAGFTNTGLGNVSIIDAQTSGLTVSTAVDAGVGNTLTLSTTSGGGLTLAANVSAAGGTVALASAGTLNQTGGIITTSALTGSSATGASLTAANLLDTLAGFSNSGLGNVAIVDAKTTGLTVTGAVDAGSGNLLTLTAGGGPLGLAASVSAAGGTVDLLSAGSIRQTAGIITAATLTGSSVDGASLGGANLFDTLAGFTNSGLGNVSITDAKASGLTVTAAVDAGAGNSLTLTTTGGGSLTLATNLSAAGGVVDLVSDGPISQTAGIITTGALRGSSAGGANLTAANLFDTLAGFTNTGLGNVSIVDAQATGPTVGGAVDAGSGNLLTLTATSGPLRLAADVSAAGGTVDLASAGTLNQTAGIITASTVTGATAGGASLTDANLFDTLAGFTNNGVGNVAITDAKATGLTVSAAVDAGAGNSLILTTTSGGSLTLGANISAAGNAVDLVSAGPLSQTGGIITAGTLTGSSAGGARLATANLFDTLAGFTNTGVGAVSITNANATGLTVTTAVDAGAGNTLTLNTSSGPLILAASLTASGAGTVDLLSAGPISQTAGIITTGTLTGVSVGGASLTDANLFASLAGFGNTGVGDVSITDSGTSGLTVSAAVDAGTGNILTVTTGGPMILAADVSAAGGTVDLVSAGSLRQTAGVITAATLTGASAGGASLARLNLFDALAGFTNRGAGDISITDARATGLTVTAAVDAGAGNTLTLTTTSGPLTLAADMAAGGSTVDLVSGGALLQTAGIITTSVLTGSSAGGASLTEVNLFDTLAGFGNAGLGAVSITDAKASGLTVSAAVDAGAGNTLTLTTANGPLTLAANLSAAGGAVDLVSAGPVNQAAGIITTGALTGSSAGGANLGGANLFDTLAGFTNAGVGAVSVTDAKASGLTATGAVDAGAGNTLTLTTTNAGPLTLAANVSVAGGTVDLVSAGALSQTAGIITTGTLTGSSVGGTGLTDANLFDTLAGFTNSGVGAVSITDAQVVGLTVTGAVDAGAANTLTLNTSGGGSLTLAADLSAAGGTVDLIATGSIRQAAGIITAGTLTGSSVGAASLAGANLFDALAGFTNTSVGDVSITDAKASGLTVTTAVDAGPGNTLTLTTAEGGLTLAADLTAAGGTVDLVSAGAISQTVGVITAGVLKGSAAGGATLTTGNQLAELGGFTNAGGGDLAITDAAASGLTITADVAVAPERALTLTTTGGPLTLAANVTASGGRVTLASSGAIDQTAGVIAAGALTGASSGGANLADGNLVGALTAFVNRDSGAITLVNAGALAVTGRVDNTLGSPGGAGRDISLTLTSGSLMGAGEFTAARDVALQAVGGSLSFAAAMAGDDLVLRAAAGVTVTGTLAATGTASAADIADPTGAGKILAAGSPITLFGLTYASLTDGSHVDVRTAAGDITLAGVASAAGDVRFQALSGAIHTHDVSAGRTIILDAATAVDRGGTASNNLSAGVDVAVQAASGSVGLGVVTAASGDVVLRSAAGAVTLVSASAGDDLVVRVASGVTVGGALTSGTAANGGGLADAFLADQPSQAMTVFGHTYASLTDGSHIDVVASAGDITVGGATTASGSGSDIRMVATGTDTATTAALNLQGAVKAGRDVVLDATGGVFGQSVNGSIAVGGAMMAGRDVAARATQGAITLTSASAGDDVVLVAPGGRVDLDGSISASGAGSVGIGATLFATVNSVLDGLFILGSQSIFIDAVSYANSGYGPMAPATLTAGAAISFALSDPSGLSLADAKPGAGSWVMASTLLAPTVSLFESKGNILVGGATVNSPVNKLNLYTGNMVSVTGAFAPATDNTVNLAVGDPVQAAWTPSQIEVINDGGGTANNGSIGFTSVSPAGAYSTSPKTFDTAALDATTDILLGDQAFITANAAVTTLAQIKQIDPSRPVPAANANMSKAVMLAAGDLTLASGSLIVQQNTSGLRTTNGAGYYVTRTLTLGAYGPFPPAIDLFGVFVRPGTTIPITGPAAADVNQIFLMGNLGASPFRALYRVNSCVIGELGNCTPTSDGIISIPLDELSRGALLSRDELDVEDPTVTGAPNEEIWRRPDSNQ